MRIKLTTDVHLTWCPKGTEGELKIENEGGLDFRKFYPDPLPEGCPWKDGIYIGNARYLEMQT